MAPTNDIDVRETLDSNDSIAFKRYFRTGSNSVRFSSSCRSSGCGTTTAGEAPTLISSICPPQPGWHTPRDHMTQGRLREVKLASAEVLHRPVQSASTARPAAGECPAVWSRPQIFQRPEVPLARMVPGMKLADGSRPINYEAIARRVIMNEKRAIW